MISWGGMHNNVVAQFGHKAYVATNYFQTRKLRSTAVQNAVVASD